MNWYYVESGRQAGPVDEAGLAALAASGKIRPETLVWREGMANWQAYREVQPAAPGTPPILGQGASAAGGSRAGEVVCAECGGRFPVSDTIQIGDARVCANCKPVFVQKMREGVPQSFAGAATNLTEEQILEREYRIDIGSAVNRGWATLTNNAGLMIGTLLLVGLLFLVFSVIGALVAKVIPFSNAVLGIFFAMPLLAGLLWLSLRLVRGEPAEVSDGFAGFKTHYVNLIGFGAIQFVINLICYIPIILVAAGLGISSTLLQRGQFSATMTPAMILGIVATCLLSICCLSFVNTLFCYVPLLIMDKNYHAWQAIQLSWRMVRRRWWMTFAFLLVSGLLYMLGVLLCCVGLLATGPLYFNMKAILYNDNFRDLAPRE